MSYTNDIDAGLAIVAVAVLAIGYGIGKLIEWIVRAAL